MICVTPSHTQAQTRQPQTQAFSFYGPLRGRDIVSCICINTLLWLWVQVVAVVVITLPVVATLLITITDWAPLHVYMAVDRWGVGVRG